MRDALRLALLLLVLASPVHAQSASDRLTSCLACHGQNGQSDVPEVPSLGAQPQLYLLSQLVLFRERVRAVEPMSELLRNATDDELRAMADFLAKLPAPKTAAAADDSARVTRARALVQEHHCNFCHDVDFSSQDNVPRLAAQREDYLLKALRGYKDQSRRAYEPLMAEVVYPLSDANLADLAYFLARQP